MLLGWKGKGGGGDALWTLPYGHQPGGGGGDSEAVHQRVFLSLSSKSAHLQKVVISGDAHMSQALHYNRNIPVGVDVAFIPNEPSSRCSHELPALWEVIHPHSSTCHDNRIGPLRKQRPTVIKTTNLIKHRLRLYIKESNRQCGIWFLDLYAALSDLRSCRDNCDAEDVSSTCHNHKANDR